VCALLLAACGEEQEPPPDIFAVKPPQGRVEASFPGAGMSFEHPRNWRLRRRGEAPRVFELLSGEAVIAGWAYPREEPLPETAEQLEAARGRLLDAIEERDPEFDVRRASTRQVAGAPAIDVRGEQEIAKRRLRTHSVHVFEGGIEYVIEAIAPPADQKLVDRRVLAPLLRSLELEGEVEEEAP
jgi:hypothetical protein